MLDVTPFLEVRPAPAAVFERAQKTPLAPRFHRRVGGAWEPVSWGSFAERIACVSLYLPGAGFDPGERAAVFGDNSVAWASAALGIQAAGGVMVPIYPASTADQAGYIIEHADVRVLFVSGAAQLTRVFNAWPHCAGLRRLVVMDDTDIAAALAAADPAVRPAPGQLDALLVKWRSVMQTSVDWRVARRRVNGIDLDATSLMLYTSGTSGRPKGVPLTHNNVGINSLGWLECNRTDLHEDAVDILWLPMSHIFGFGELCLGNTLGFTSYLCKPQEALGLMPVVRPTVFMSVPAYWEKLASTAWKAGDAAAAAERLGELTGGRLRFCLSGGAGLKREVKDLFWSAGVLIIEGYGLTECSPTLTLNRRDAFRFDSVGKTLANVELRLASDGEIQARGPSIFSGYHKDPDATAGAFTQDGWFKTGDLGRMTDDGFLQIIGRKKEILVTAGGKNVAPANIELAFADDPLFERVVVYGDGKKYLVAAVWLAPGADADEALIQQRIDAVNGGLARFETIKKFRVINRPLTVEDGFLTASLKLRRKQVYETFGPELEALYD